VGVASGNAFVLEAQQVAGCAMCSFVFVIRPPSSGNARAHVLPVLRRGVYTAIAVASLTNTLTDELRAHAAGWIARCQTYEGGLGGEPGLEAHGGYTFCGVAALALLGPGPEGLGCLRSAPLLRWLASCQKRLEGGFHGRTNKLVDGCYSFWQGGTFAVLGQTQGEEEARVASALARGGLLGDEMDSDGRWLFDQGALQDYLLVCGQMAKGGMRDKPGKEADFYHTCYCLSGLSVAQHSTTSSGVPQLSHLPYGEASKLVRARIPCNASRHPRT